MAMKAQGGRLVPVGASSKFSALAADVQRHIQNLPELRRRANALAAEMPQFVGSGTKPALADARAVGADIEEAIAMLTSAARRLQRLAEHTS